MTIDRKKLAREKKTIECMVKIYCNDLHGTTDKLCPECGQLLVYARKRITSCVLKENKTTCAKCPVHCYKPLMREKIKKVMRYSGPRMMYKHPVLALLHLCDGAKTKAVKSGEKKQSKW